MLRSTPIWGDDGGAFQNLALAGFDPRSEMREGESLVIYGIDLWTSNNDTYFHLTEQNQDEAFATFRFNTFYYQVDRVPLVAIPYEEFSAAGFSTEMLNTGNIGGMIWWGIRPTSLLTQRVISSDVTSFAAS